MAAADENLQARQTDVRCTNYNLVYGEPDVGLWNEIIAR